MAPLYAIGIVFAIFALFNVIDTGRLD